MRRSCKLTLSTIIFKKKKDQMSTYDMIKDRNTAFLVDVPGGKQGEIVINEIQVWRQR